jgi:ribA/ribD-fused uncharacterized protein
MRVLDGELLRDDAIMQFNGVYRFLSNFWMVPVRYANLTYSSVEQAYQAAKTLDPVQRARLISATSPMEAKRIGSDPALTTVRKDWDKLKFQIMEGLLRQKFYKGGNCGNLLAYTNDRQLVEGNYWHDNIWGVCLCRTRLTCGFDDQKPIPRSMNNLGRLLMLIRDDNR